MRYIITAYKSDSFSTCRGCLMATYSSDFEFIDTDDREEAINFLALIKYRNTTLEIDETGYEFTFFYPNPDEDDFQAELNEADKLVCEYQAQEKARKEAEEALEREKAIAAGRARDLAELERLTKKLAGEA